MLHLAGLYSQDLPLELRRSILVTYLDEDSAQNPGVYIMKGALGDPFNQRVSDVCNVEVQNRADLQKIYTIKHNPIISWKKLEPETMHPILKRSFWSWK